MKDALLSHNNFDSKTSSMSNGLLLVLIRLNNSFQFQEYRNGQPFLFPFHFLLIPVTIWYRSEIERQHILKRITTGNLEGQTERDKLFCTLCDRYSRSLASSEMCGMIEGYMNIDRRETFAEVVALERHNSIMRGARKTKSKTKRLKRESQGNLSERDVKSTV